MIVGLACLMLAAVPLPRLVTGASVMPVGDARRGYGTEKAQETVARLQKLGVNTIAILMEGRMSSLSATSIAPPPAAKIEAALLDAKKQGLATVLIPHIYLDDGEWRGRIDHRDPRAREEWWNSYHAFITGAAEVADRGDATMLSIGVELKALSKQPDFAAKMFTLASDVRRVFKGALTYSANWDEAEEVLFWGAVDIAGVNGYYPLVPDPVRGAEAVGRRLVALSRIARREVLVLEVGYRSSPLSHVKPWEWPDQVHAIVDDAAQANAWAAVLTAWLGLENVRGLLIWVVPTDPDDPASEPRHGFNPLNKAAEEVIARAFRRSA
jgi:hypothetical protein